jgi:hypothetical protein
MTSLWPWLAVAGLGALHGANPATGWMFATACGRAGRRSGAGAVGAAADRYRSCGPSVALVALALVQGLAFDRAGFQMLAGALLVGAAGWRALRRGYVTQASFTLLHCRSLAPEQSAMSASRCGRS